MRKILFLIVFAFPILQVNSKTCHCGSFEEGIYSFGVEGEESGCCTSRAVGLGMTGDSALFTTYEYNEGAWEPVRSELITPTSAQSKCCPPNA